MDTSVYLARVFGVYLVVACVAMLINRKHIPKILEGFSNNLGLVVFSGFIHLFLGLLTVMIHNVWTPDFRGLVTIVAWVGVIKGGLRIFAPTKIFRFGEEFVGGKKFVAWGIVWFAIGVYLLWAGFFT